MYKIVHETTENTVWCMKCDYPEFVGKKGDLEMCNACSTKFAEAVFSMKAGHPVKIAKRGDVCCECYYCGKLLDAYEIYPVTTRNKFGRDDTHKACADCGFTQS